MSIKNKTTKCKSENCDKRRSNETPFCVSCYKEIISSNDVEKINFLNEYEKQIQIQRNQKNNFRKITPVSIPIKEILNAYNNIEKKDCCISGCNVKQRSFKLCRKHYRFYEKHNPEEFIQLKMQVDDFLNNQKCSECCEKIYAKGLCEMHYKKHYSISSNGIAARFRNNQKENKASSEQYFAVDSTNDSMRIENVNGVLEIHTNYEILKNILGKYRNGYIRETLESLKESGELDFKINYYNKNVVVYIKDVDSIRTFFSEQTALPDLMDVNGRWRRDDDRKPRGKAC